MVKYRVTIDQQTIEFSSMDNFNAWAAQVNYPGQPEQFTETQTVDYANLIDTKIAYFQSVAPALIRGLYVTNTMAGITTAQSDQMFDDYIDVLLRIREGAFPTALYRLNAKVPAGFVGQGLIDAWKAKILSYLQ
jgi:hypothetical protein